LPTDPNGPIVVRMTTDCTRLRRSTAGRGAGLIAWFCFACVPPAVSAQDADAAMGENIAQEYCIVCHDISPEGPFKLDPPSFAAIAKYRTPEQIRARIVKPIHHTMPRYVDYMIGNNIDDMVAYIVSLED
jgi:mono/diheme cytochrome c family protein